MRVKAVSIGVLAAAIAIAPISSAAAWPHFFHHGPGHGGGPIFGLFGLGAAVVVGAATIATAPIAIIADAASSPGYERRGGNYAPPQAYYRPAPGYYGAYQGYPPPQAYYAPPQGYGPPPGYYGPQQGYYGPSQGYSRPQAYYGPPQRYAVPPSYGDQQGYAPPGYGQPTQGYGAPAPGG